MDGGRKLNKIGVATENELSPYVTSFERWMFRVIVVDWRVKRVDWRREMVDDKYSGVVWLMHLYVRRRVLNLIIDSTGNQWRDLRIGVMCWRLDV